MTFKHPFATLFLALATLSAKAQMQHNLPKK